jgi:hypothetical protein
VYEASIAVDSSLRGGSATIDFTLSQRVCEASIAVDPSSRGGSATLASFIDELALEQEADPIRVWYAQ